MTLPQHTHTYLWAPVLDAISSSGSDLDVLDLGCGAGAFSLQLAKLGHRVVGVDLDSSEIDRARQAASSTANAPRFICASSDELQSDCVGTFDLVVSLEVIEHVFLPSQFASKIFESLKPGGTAIISTPYHGYLKNLSLAIFDKFDDHFTALWDGGHIKFFSQTTLTQLLVQQGFRVVRCLRVGRIPPLAKSLVVIAQRPAGPLE
ncbi:MAG: methyltransferase domain-containing protein [Pirellulales bacterium]